MNLPDLSGTAVKFMNVFGALAKKLKNLLISEIDVIGQSSSKWPGSGSHTLMGFYSVYFHLNLFDARDALYKL